MKNGLLVAAATSLSLLLSACAPKLGGNDYSVAGAGEISRTSLGTIISARPVTINASNPSQLGTGAVIGGLTGAALGSQVGHGSGPVVVGALGALGGGVAGHMIEGGLKSQEGIEYSVRLDSGATITLAQGAEPRLSVGQRVMVVESHRDRSRIVPA